MNWNFNQHQLYLNERIERAKKQRQIDELMRQQEEAPRRPIRRRRSGGSTI